VDYFTEKCREVYFCTDDYSDAAFVISNFGIYSIFYELGSTDPDPNLREEYLSYIEMCRNNLETALANLNILMPATQESIKALAVGVSLLPSSEFSRTSSILIKTGYARTGDLETVCRLDPSVNSHAFMPNTWISPLLINGARSTTNPKTKATSLLVRLYSTEHDVSAPRARLFHSKLRHQPSSTSCQSRYPRPVGLRLCMVDQIGHHPEQCLSTTI
jgi:hypothetical protein